MSNWFSEEMPNEVPFSEIEARSDEFHSWNFVPETMQEIGYESISDTLKTYTAEKYEALDDAGKEAMVKEVLDLYRSIDLLPIQYYSDLGVMNEIEKCIAYKAAFDGDTVSCGAGVGTTLCNYLFPNLFDVPSQHDLDKKGAETLFAKFHNDEYLSKAIKFCFSYKNGCPTPTNVMGGLRLVGSAPTNFRPMNAKAVYERFCPEGGTVYDFCCCDGDTEYFNGEAWVKLSDYKYGDRVLQYEEDGRASLVYPIEYLKAEGISERAIHFVDDKIDTCLTLDHDVLYKKVVDGNVEKKIYTMKASDTVKEKELWKGDMVIPLTFNYNPSSKDMEIDSFVDGPFPVINAILASSNLVKYNEERGVFERNFEWHYEDAVFNIFDEFTLDSIRGYVTMSDGVVHLAKKYYYMNDFLKAGTAEELMNIVNCRAGLDSIVMNSKEDADIVQFLIMSSDYYFLYSVNAVVEGRRVLFNHSEGRFGDRYQEGRFTTYYDKESEYIILNSKYCFVVPSHMLILRRNGKIFITRNCGFGGRMLGCLSSKKNFRYVGTDPCTETMYHLHELGDYIEMVTGRDDSYELHCCGSEDFCGPAESIDFAFSSPPYFNLEVYSDEETQCFNKFPVLEDWLEGYVRATIKNIHHMLKRGAVYAVNIADFTVGGGKECAYVDEWIRISTEEGMPLYDTVYLGVTARAGSKQQAAGELKKENILIFKKPL